MSEAFPQLFRSAGSPSVSQPVWENLLSKKSVYKVGTETGGFHQPLAKNSTEAKFLVPDWGIKTTLE
jgi:hypothetical protein